MTEVKKKRGRPRKEDELTPIFLSAPLTPEQIKSEQETERFLFRNPEYIKIRVLGMLLGFGGVMASSAIITAGMILEKGKEGYAEHENKKAD